jgi:hypothetical protein
MGIAQGDHFVIAWEDIEPRSWEDPDFLKHYEADLKSVRLEPGKTLKLELTALNP